MKKRALFVLCLASVFGCSAFAAIPRAIPESARSIPIVGRYDVVVAGGSVAAVSAAIEARKNGAKVMLVAPRNYLGDDAAGTLRLSLEADERIESALAKKLFSDTARRGDLPFRYVADRPTMPPHKDTSPPSVLCDGRWSDPAHESVQYDGDVTIRMDLGSVQALKLLRAVVFRGRDYGVEKMTVTLSSDNKTFRSAGTVACDSKKNGPIELAVELAGEARYVRCSFEKASFATRILLGEISLDSAKAADAPPCRDVTPLHLKKTLQESIAEAGVGVLLGCYATDVIRTEGEPPRGIIIADRSGRQAVLAGVIVDATPSANLAQRAGTGLRSVYSGPQEVLYRVLAKETKPEAAGLSVRKLDLPVPIRGRIKINKGSVDTTGAAWYEYRLSYPHSLRWLEERIDLDQWVRDRTYTPTQVYSADSPFFVPPHTIYSEKDGDPKTRAFRPHFVPCVWVLGPCADVSREEARRLSRLTNSIDIGAKVGAAAALEASQIPRDRKERKPGASGSGTETKSPFEVKELLDGLRTAPGGEKLQQNAVLPIGGEYDVVVVGGGTAGAPAAIAASRGKAKTLVIEYQNGLGGVGTLGMIGGYWYGNRVGFTATVPESPTEVRMEWYRSEIRKAGGDIWFGALGCGAIVKNGKVCGVVVATPESRFGVLAKTVVDATGSADIAIAAGAAYQFIEPEYAVQASHLPVREPGQSYINGDCPAIDDSDPINVTAAVRETLEKSHGDFDLGQLVDSRERRRIVGDYCLDWLDIINRRTFPDTIVQACSDYDSHGYQIHPFFDLTHVPPKTKFWANVPYRSILPKDLDGILVVGIGMSAHRDAMPITRMQPDQHNLGYAAGLAAAMVAPSSASVRQVDVKALQRRLVEIGNIPADVMETGDSYPIPKDKISAAVAAVAQDYRDVEVLLAQPKESLPLVRAAFDRTTGRDKLIYANVLAALGDTAGVPLLIEAIEKRTIEPVSKGRGAGGYLGMIRVVGRTRDRRAVPALVALTRGPEIMANIQLLRSVTTALGEIGDPAAAPVLAELLTAVKPEVISPQSAMTACALFRCGDQDGVARKTLERYAVGENGPLARLARQTLNP